MKTYNETRCLIQKKNEKGEVTAEQILAESAANKALDKAKESGESVEIAAMQTFTFYEFESVEEFTATVTNPTEQMNIINRAAVLKQQSSVRDILTDENFAAVEGAYDLKDELSAVRERRKADPASKAAKALSELLGFEVKPGDLATILTQFQPQAATPGA